MDRSPLARRFSAREERRERRYEPTMVFPTPGLLVRAAVSGRTGSLSARPVLPLDMVDNLIALFKSVRDRIFISMQSRQAIFS
jgi:hypothetical protein